MKSTITLLLIAALHLAASSQGLLAASPQPNIVVILVDDMGWSDIGCYGGEIETPNLDALARSGVRLTQFYNTARCCPTRAALLTGLYQHQAGIGHMTGDDGIPSYQGYLNDRCLTIAEALRPAGYTTLTAGKWHVGSAPGQWPLDRGFDRFWGTPSGGGVYFKETLQVRTNVFFVNGDQPVEPPDDLYVTDTFTTQALAFIEEAVTQTQKPFFLYLAHIAPHWPLQAKPEDIAKYRARYDAGWDEVRRRRFQRQKAMQLVPSDATLSPRDPQARAWDDVPEAERRELSHRMQVYAAQIDCIDQNVGRLVNKLKELGQFNPVEHGWDEFFGYLGGNVHYFNHGELSDLDVLDRGREPVGAEGYMTHLITDASIDFIERHRDRPFFLFVSHECPHFPFQRSGDRAKVVTEQNWTESDPETYVAMLEDLDREVGRLLAVLDQREIAKDALVVFVSDNGGFEGAAHMGPLRGAKGTTFEGGIRVPRIVRWPGRIPAATQCDQVSATFDLTCSLLKLAGAEVPGGRLDG